MATRKKSRRDIFNQAARLTAEIERRAVLSSGGRPKEYTDAKGRQHFMGTADWSNPESRRQYNRRSKVRYILGKYNRKMRASQKERGIFGKRGSLDEQFERSQYISKSLNKG